MNYITSKTLLLLFIFDFSSGQCGIPAITPTRLLKIIGGTTSTPNSWPWQVLIRTSTSICGASLINSQWLLTAAHCDFSAWAVTAVLGAHDVSLSSFGTSVSVSKAIPHPNYDATAILNDIQLMKLTNAIEFTTKISPICLPESKTYSYGDTLTVTGWGVTSEGGSVSSVLLQTDVNVNQSSVCTTPFNISPLESTQLCAGQFNPAHDACQGDSGGPLVKLDASTGKYWQVGIVSYGVGCAGNGVYTKVSEYETWIAATIADNSSAQFNLGKSSLASCLTYVVIMNICLVVIQIMST